MRKAIAYLILGSFWISALLGCIYAIWLMVGTATVVALLGFGVVGTSVVWAWGVIYG